MGFDQPSEQYSFFHAEINDEGANGQDKQSHPQNTSEQRPGGDSGEGMKEVAGTLSSGAQNPFRGEENDGQDAVGKRANEAQAGKEHVSEVAEPQLRSGDSQDKRPELGFEKTPGFVGLMVTQDPPGGAAAPDKSTAAAPASKPQPPQPPSPPPPPAASTPDKSTAGAAVPEKSTAAAPASKPQPPQPPSPPPPAAASTPDKSTAAGTLAKSGGLQDRMKLFEGASPPVTQQPATRPAMRPAQPEDKDLIKESRLAKAQLKQSEAHLKKLDEAVEVKREESVSARILASQRGAEKESVNDKEMLARKEAETRMETRITETPMSPSREQGMGSVNLRSSSPNHPHSFETHPESYMAPFQGFR